MVRKKKSSRSNNHQLSQRVAMSSLLTDLPESFPVLASSNPYFIKQANYCSKCKYYHVSLLFQTVWCLPIALKMKSKIFNKVLYDLAPAYLHQLLLCPLPSIHTAHFMYSAFNVTFSFLLKIFGYPVLITTNALSLAPPTLPLYQTVISNSSPDWNPDTQVVFADVLDCIRAHCS